MYIYFEESRVAFHFLSSNIAGQLFEIAGCQKEILIDRVLRIFVFGFIHYGVRAKPRTLFSQPFMFLSSQG